MAKSNGMNNTAKFLIPIVVALTLTISLGIAKWTVGKTMDLDKAVATEAGENKLEHKAFKQKDDDLTELSIELKEMLKVQQVSVHRIDKTVGRIEERLKKTP